MELCGRGKTKKNAIMNKLESYMAASRRKKSAMETSLLPKSKPLCVDKPVSPNRSGGDRRVAPSGCFSVYVGTEKQRFVIKTSSANHPLFRMLLEVAELEYGFNPHGPLLLPCDVDLFCKILVEIDGGGESDQYSCGYCSPFHRV